MKLPTSISELLKLSGDAPAGQGVRVGVIDTGIDRATLERQGYVKPIEGIILDSNQRLPYTGLQSAPHGTTVAGILVRHAPSITLVTADVFGPRGQCDVETLIRAVQWCIDEAGCQVLNLSLGITEDRLLPVQRRWQLQRMMEECYHRNVIAVAAAHNDHPQCRSFPALLGSPLIGVSKGPWHHELQLRYQPCERVEFQATASADGDFLAQTPASSWAAPHVSAIIARLLTIHPGLKPFEVKTALRRLSHEVAGVNGIPLPPIR